MLFVLPPTLRMAPEFDAAVIILTPDDYVGSRIGSQSLRDNILLELGLFIGAIGRDRVYVLTCGTDQRFTLPTDLAGINYSSIALPPRGKLTAAVAPFWEHVSYRLKSIHSDPPPESPPLHRGHAFVSYSHKDAKWLDHLQTTLQPIIRGDRVSLWDDTRFNPERIGSEK